MSFRLFPLQNLSDFAMTVNARDVIFFFVGVAAIITALIVATSARKRGKVSAFKEEYVPRKRQKTGFSVLALHRIARSLGLDSTKTRMLEFVLRNDRVTDLKQSFESPELMDRHFKQAFRQIEQSSKSEKELDLKLSTLFAVRNVIEVHASAVNITSTNQIRENTPATLKYGNGSYPTKVSSAKGDALLVEHPRDSGGQAVAIPKGSNVSLEFLSKSNNGFIVLSRVIDYVEGSNRPLIKLAHSGNINSLSKRMYRRKKLILPVNIQDVNVVSAGFGKEPRLVVDKRKNLGTIQDISVGGCSIHTTVPFKAGQKLKLEFSKGERAAMAALGEVLRTNKTGYNTVVHVKFLKIPRKSLNFINTTVYEYGD
ncbi:MAG: PilZ domain-containing protein [Treponema sp.]|jgi:hypothetical protein|nr:PilZ domain-containing protein [Treponema sp.]